MRLILQALFIIVLLSTFSICAIKPDMHKTVFVYDSAYTLVPENKTEVETTTIPIAEMPVIKEETVSQKAQTVKTIEKPVQQTKIIKEQTVSKPKVQTVQQVKKQEIPQQQTVRVVKKETPKSTTIQKLTQPQEKQLTTQQTVESVPKTISQQEETIAWNTWRSNIQNKIMQDVKLPILPAGVVFRFSFTVDKYGKISNLQTWSDTPTYTPYAIQYVAPVIRGYQGRSILNFPEGSSRTVTEVKGGWKISAHERYSTPQDYNDIEKVIK